MIRKASRLCAWGCLLALPLSACKAKTDTATSEDAAPNPAPAKAPTAAAKATEPLSAVPTPSKSKVAQGFELPTFRVTYKVSGLKTGTMTLWVEDQGGRAAMREDVSPMRGAPVARVDTFWDGKKSFIRNGTKPVASSPFRPIDTEPSSMVRSGAAEKAALGWAEKGERTVAGQTCKVFKNEKMGGIELCVWKGIDLQFLSKPASREATEVVVGEKLPDEMVALAK